MKNKLLLAGAFAVAGFVGLTAFGGTKAEQEAQIKAAVETKLAEYTTELQDACTARVEAEAQTRYSAIVAERVAAMPGGKKPTTKPKGTKGPKVDPLPQPTKPANTGTERPGAVKKDDPSAPVSRPGAVKKDEAPAPVSRPGAVKKEGGGGK